MDQPDDLQDDGDWSDYFAGAVPAGVTFDMQVSDIKRISGDPKQSSEDKRLDPTAELALIGLTAYFEAFCKNHFASLINIHPPLVLDLAKRGCDVTLTPAHLVETGDPILPRLGFLLAERLDFGTARNINLHYTRLIQCTPFNKDEADRFERLIDDRNLLVHHGGIFNLKYATERFVAREIARSRAFLDSLLVTSQDVHDAADFLQSVSRKVRDSTNSALRALVTPQTCKGPDHLLKAINAIAWQDEL